MNHATDCSFSGTACSKLDLNHQGLTSDGFLRLGRVFLPLLDASGFSSELHQSLLVLELIPETTTLNITLPHD